MYLCAINLYKSQLTYYLQTNIAPPNWGTFVCIQARWAQLIPFNPGWLRRAEKQKGYMAVCQNLVPLVNIK